MAESFALLTDAGITHGELATFLIIIGAETQEHEDPYFKSKSIWAVWSTQGTNIWIYPSNYVFITLEEELLDLAEAKLGACPSSLIQVDRSSHGDSIGVSMEFIRLFSARWNTVVINYCVNEKIYTYAELLMLQDPARDFFWCSL
jgi:hypothetical protein